MQKQIYDDEMLRQRQLDAFQTFSTEKWVTDPNNQPAAKLPVHDASVIPENRRQEIRDYAQKLKTKFPHMKDKRIAKKTAEYFRIKLV